MMKILRKKEISDVSGGFAPLIFGAAAGIGGNWFTNTISQPGFDKNSPSSWWPAAVNGIPSWQSAVYSGSVGALTGGATSALVGAAGGGLIGNLSQRPGMIALGWGIQQTNPWK